MNHQIQSTDSDTILKSADCNYPGSFLYGSYNKHTLPESENTKPQSCSKLKICIWLYTLHVSDSSSVHHQEFFAVHSNGIRHTACEQDQDGTAVPSWSCSQAVGKPVGHIPLLCVHKKWNKIASDIKLVFHSSTICIWRSDDRASW